MIEQRKPIALIVDEAHDLHSKTLIGLKRLMEVVADGGGTSSSSSIARFVEIFRPCLLLVRTFSAAMISA